MRSERPAGGLHGRAAVRAIVTVGMHRLLRTAPAPVVSWVGSLEARLARLRRGRRRHLNRLARFLKHLRPDLPLERRQDMAVRCLDGFSRQAAEIALGPGFCGSRYLTIRGRAHLEAARASGRPLIFCLLHLGNWQIVPAATVSLGVPTTVIIYPMPNPLDQRIVTAFRRRCGVETLQRGYGGAAGAFRTLRQGRALMLSIDERHNERINAPRFGRTGVAETGNISIAVRLAHATGALLLPIYTLRQAGVRLVLTIAEPIDLLASMEGTADGRLRPLAEADLRAGIDRLEQAIAPVILDNLDQWIGIRSLMNDRHFARRKRAAAAVSAASP
ncbi:MAG: lysophospholipid acyltransferase family protein [Rhodospirillaceae bacterium]|nr:lysophospholipid acyltransferase family protein [Rhodospirillaceae bacterium]